MIYAGGRVSTDKQENSLDLQRRTNNDFCLRLFKQLPDVELYDNDASGKLPLLKRPKGRELVNAKKGDKIVFMKHDRMFRNMANGVLTVEKWFKEGVSLYLINLGDQPIDMNNPEKKFQFYIMLATAVLERDNIAKRTKDGMYQRKLSGKTYAKPVYGYDNAYERNANGDRVNGKLVRNEKEQEVLAEILALRDTGTSYQKISNWLNKRGILTKQGCKWSKHTLMEMMKNDIHSLKVA